MEMVNVQMDYVIVSNNTQEIVAYLKCVLKGAMGMEYV